MPCCIHGYVVPGAVAGVVVIAVFGLSVYRVDGHVDGAIGRGVEGAIVHSQGSGVPA